ncbi:hypothetical protein [Spirillospora sp. NBC_01491]|uniref:hypothetical protein n=1 Tax=Spirillospora sp. NBC_01491 TaxID=2976007 RepID=UPI002E2F5C46|nr:hypothetical protein [Spirillospora sp. NBC_01491]
MTTAPPKPPRGRHAKPPSRLSARWNRLVSPSSGESGRRRRLIVAGGAASAAVLAAAAVVGFSVTGSRDAPRAVAAAHTGKEAARPSALAGSKAPATRDPDEVPEAVPYFETQDTGKKVVKHVTDVRRSGDFVRIYTDLGEGDENSEPAVSLCEWTTKLLEQGGDDDPRVFVHGKSSDNGSVVLANKQSDKDDCEVGETR